MKISRSIKNYSSKPSTIEVAGMKFKNESVDVTGLKEALENGYAVNYALIDENGRRTKKNFESKSFVTIDFDNVDFSLDEAVEMTVAKPNLGYYSYSDNPTATNGRRFHLVYCFDEGLTVEESEGLWRAVNSEVEWTGKTDTSTKSAYQIIYGTDKEVVLFNEIPYKKTDFKIPEEAVKTPVSLEDMRMKKEDFEISIDEEFLKDFSEMKAKAFLAKYENDFIDREKTQVVGNADCPFVFAPEKFYEIKRAFKIDEDGNYHLIKTEDGQRRRKALFMNAVIRLNICPTLSIENLIWNLYGELVKRINNACSDKITRREVVSIAINAFKTKGEYPEVGLVEKKFLVNPAFCRKYGVTPKQVMEQFGSEGTSKYMIVLRNPKTNKIVKKFTGAIEAARFLGITVETVYAGVKKGGFKSKGYLVQKKKNPKIKKLFTQPYEV